MKVPRHDTIKTASQARQLAIDYQNWASEQNLSYAEILDWQELFETLATRFNLTQEFAENGII